MPQELMQYRYKRICLLAALLWMAVIFRPCSGWR